MHRDDVSRSDAVCKTSEISDNELQTVREPSRLSLASGRLEVGRRRIDERRRVDAAREQREIEVPAACRPSVPDTPVRRDQGGGESCARPWFTSPEMPKD